MLNIFNWLIENGAVVISAVSAILAALIAIFMLIPGEAPEKQFRVLADFLAKFSRK